MTKYEYNHNPEHKEDYGRCKGDCYCTPNERIFIIILINIAIIFTPLTLYFEKWVFFTLFFSIIGLSFFCEYNIFYNFERIQWLLYLFFSKKNSYKEFLIYINEYENLLKIEQKIHSIKIRKSYLNCKKLICHSRKNKYIIKENKIININIDNKEIINVPKVKNMKELIQFYKEIIN